LLALDTPEAVPITPDEAYIKGWFVPEDSEACSLSVLVENESVPVFTGLPRPDVAAHYRNDPAFLRSGFAAHLHRGTANSSATLIAQIAGENVVLAKDIQIPAAQAFEPHLRPVFHVNPLISVVLDLTDVHPYLAARALQSIVRQTYADWQLCLIGQSRPAFNFLDWKKLEHENRLGDPAKPAGDFVILLDHRDELDRFALEEIAAVASSRAQGKPDLIYADEAQICFYGDRGSAVRKPPFDPEALLSWNYFGRGVAHRRELFRGSDSDSWANLLAVVQTAERVNVHHIAKPLYLTRTGDPLTSPLPRASDPPKPEIVRPYIEEAACVEPGLFSGSFRIRRALASDSRVAVVLRPEDGAFQRAVLEPLIDTRRVHFYQTKLQASGPDEFTPHEVTEEVVIFINGPLDTVNHLFVEELSRQALRADCAMATGISLDARGRILHAGFQVSETGDETDAYAGLNFADTDLPRELSVVRSVGAIAPLFFAVKRGHTPQLARTDDRRVVVTPFAVATFDIMSGEQMPETDPQISDAESKLKQIASERNYLRRELEIARERLTSLEASRCQDLKSRIDELEAALAAQQQVHQEMQNSASWKLTAPLRAGLRALRGR
jgi:hypothetical protein